MHEWDEKASNIIFWLEQAEKEFENYTLLPEDLKALEEFAAKYDVRESITYYV